MFSGTSAGWWFLISAGICEICYAAAIPRTEGFTRPWPTAGTITAMRGGQVPSVIVIDTDPMPGTGAGGTWWDVAVPEVSDRREVNEARKGYEEATKRQWLVN